MNDICTIEDDAMHALEVYTAVIVGRVGVY